MNINAVSKKIWSDIEALRAAGYEPEISIDDVFDDEPLAIYVGSRAKSLEFDESKHRRDNSGRFTFKDGDGEASSDQADDEPFMLQSSAPTIGVRSAEWAEKLTEIERSMLRSWGASSSNLRDGHFDSDKWDELLDSAPKFSGVVYRGLSNVPGSVVENWKPGGVIKLDFDQSSSIDRHVADQRGGAFGEDKASVMWVVKQNSGAAVLGNTGVYYGDDPQTGWVDESEVILRKGSRYQIDSVKYIDAHGNDFPPQWYAESMKLSKIAELRDSIETLKKTVEKYGQSPEPIRGPLPRIARERLADKTAELEAAEKAEIKIPDDWRPHRSGDGFGGRYVIEMHEIEPAIRPKDYTNAADAADYVSNQEDWDSIVKHFDLKELELPGGAKVWRDEDDVYTYSDGYVSRSSVNEFVYNADLLDYYPDLVDGIVPTGEVPGEVYHATTRDGAIGILRTGIGARDETRGMTNRHTGSAVFTTAEWDRAMSGAYGDYVFSIDVDKMRKDGVLSDYVVTREPGIVEAELRRSLAMALGEDDFDTDDMTRSDGVDPDTLIFDSGIPRKYLTLAESKGESIDDLMKEESDG